MTTTTIRMPPDLKTRVAAAAKRSGTTAHGFILEAIAKKAAQEEQRAEGFSITLPAIRLRIPPGGFARSSKQSAYWTPP